MVLRSLESVPDRRYQHASDLKTGIESIKDDTDTPQAAARSDTAGSDSSVRDQLRVPAIGLRVASIVNLLVTLSIVVLEVLSPDGPVGSMRTIIFVVIALSSLAMGIVLMIGSARMRDLRSYPIALSAAIVATFPCALGAPISLPFGIWALIVLSRRNVRTAFRRGI